MLWRPLLIVLVLVTGLGGNSVAAGPDFAVDVENAVRRGLTRVTTAASNWPSNRTCFSCHHQTLPILAVIQASRVGFAMDQEWLRSQAEIVHRYLEERIESMRVGEHVPGGSTTVGYGLWALAMAGRPPDETTSAAIAYLLKIQGTARLKDLPPGDRERPRGGRWTTSCRRPPMQGSDVADTVLALVGMKRYATAEQQPAVAASSAAALQWLERAPIKTQEDRIWRLWGLHQLDGDAAAKQSVRAAILAAQQDDGGWPQTDDRASDAFSTGQTLFVLSQTGMPTDGPALGRARDYLLRTQLADGSWRVESHVKFKAQPFFDNGDPHGEHQFISTAATAWATAALAGVLPFRPAPDVNFTTGAGTARKFGVHEVELTGNGQAANPLDTIATVTFTPPSGERNAKTVNAFYDGGNTWRARVYVSEIGDWRWRSECSTDAQLDDQAGGFLATGSTLRGRLLPHPKNPRHWMTEDGRWFLNLSDTAYFLLCARDGNGGPVTDEQALQYASEDVERGITSIRCFLASRDGGFNESTEQWREWYFTDDGHDTFRLDTLQQADRRLRLLLDHYPDVAVQLILFPLVRYAVDDTFWAGLKPAQRERLLRHLVARYAAYPQLFWLIVNDAHYGPKYPRNNAMVREVGSYLKQHDPWRHPCSTGHARRVPFFFGDEDWATYIHLEHAHDLGAGQYAPYDGFAKPVFLGEDRYEQDHGARLDPRHMKYWQRRLFWAWLLSGGSTNYGGRWWAVQPYTTTGTTPTAYHKRPNVTFRAALTGLDSVRPIRDYFESRGIALSDFEPEHKLVGDADGAKDARAPRLMRRGLVEFLIYHPNAASDGQDAQVDATRAARLRVDLSQARGRFAVEWYRAEDGKAEEGGSIDGGKAVELAAPWPGADVVLRIRRVGD